MGRTPTKRKSRAAPAKAGRRARTNKHATQVESDDGGVSDGSPPKSRPSKRKVKAPKKPDEDDDDDSGAARVSWDKDPTRAERLLDWLETNVDDRIKLFSDSTQDAAQEGRKKKTGKTPKIAYYKMIAEKVFSVDADESLRADYQKKPIRYARSVENYIKRLRKRYGEINKELGQTGAGLRVEDVEPGSEIENKIQKIKAEFPQWERLHGFWRTLPNFNPFTVSSEPGQNIADQAIALITGGADHFPVAVPNDSQSTEDQDVFNPSSPERTPEPTDRSNSQHIEWSPSPKRGAPINVDDDEDELPPPPFKLPEKTPALRNSSKPNVQSSGSISSHSSASSAVKPRLGKRSRAEAFAEENKKQNEVLAQLGKDKHDRRMAELAVKRKRLDVDLQREKLVAEERRLAAEDRRREAEHKREREREQHQLMMMRMQFTMQNGNTNRRSDGFNNGGSFLGGMDANIFGGFGTEPAGGLGMDAGGEFGTEMGGDMGYLGGAGPSSAM